MHVFIIGAPAAGKMTIGQELSKLTGATLFFNHQPIDFALEIYQDFTEEMWEFVRSVNFSFLGTSARHHRSVIFTGVTDFSNQYHLMYLKNIQDLLNEYHQEILFVELETSLEERLRRNRTENRLKYKPLKRNFEVSEREILETDKTNQLNSQKQPSGLHYYLKIDNTNLSAEEVAKQIQEKSENNRERTHTCLKNFHLNTIQPRLRLVVTKNGLMKMFSSLQAIKRLSLIPSSFHHQT